MRLVWSNRARQDLEALKRYSVDTWGAAVASRYLRDIRDGAKASATNPERTRVLREPYRIVRVRSHYLILHLSRELQQLTVARVLHVAMDIERHLS